MQQHNGTDYAKLVADLTLTQFKSSPRILGFMKSVATVLQSLDDEIGELWKQKSLFTAEGKWLTIIGAGWLETPRETASDLDDEVYRQKIFNTALKMMQSGEIPSIIGAVKAVTGLEDIRLHEYYPRFFQIKVFDDNPLAKSLLDQLKDVKVGGVGFQVLIGEARDSNKVGRRPYLFKWGDFSAPPFAGSSGGPQTFGPNFFKPTTFFKLLQ